MKKTDALIVCLACVMLLITVNAKNQWIIAAGSALTLAFWAAYAVRAYNARYGKGAPENEK